MIFFREVDEEPEHPVEIAHRDDGSSVAGKRVVRVVPFRTLHVHPDSAARNVVQEFRKEKLDDFCRERRQLQILAVENAPRVHSERFFL